MLHIDTLPVAMLGRPVRNQSDVVPVIRRPKRVFDLSNWRGLFALLVATVYLLSGTLHGLHDLDVTNPSGHSEIASVLDTSAGHADHKALAGHHCHGCFSVTVAQQAQSKTSIALVSAGRASRAGVLGRRARHGLPAPKRLT